jgi:ribosomal protein S21
MALEVRKENKETSQSLMRRFSKAMQQSGILRQARKTRFKTRRKSEGMKKKAALRKEDMREEFEKLKKLGKRAE